MCNLILLRTFVSIFTCLVCCGLAATTIHREGPNLLSSQQSNLSQSRVSISVKVVKNDQHIKLKTSQDLKLLEDILKVTHSDITIYVHQPSWNHSVVWNLKPSPLLISKDLKVVYFNSSATQRNHINSRKLTCFYSGFEGVGHLLSQVELCNGVFDADLHYLNNLYKIMTSEGEKGKINLFMLQKHIPQISGKCGNKVDLGLHRVPRSVKKEAHAPALNNFSTRYIEMYLVADHKLFLRSGSNRNQTVSRLLKIVNYASSLFQKLNIYLALVGIEVWENGDKIDVTGNINQVLRDFEYYRRTVISANTPNDNAQLIVAESFDENLIGQASSSICSHAGGAGVSADHYVDNWVMAATTLAHELGHNLGLDHDDELPNSAECTCPQVDGVNHCIMHSGSSSIQPVDWSVCSQRVIQNKFAYQSIDYCLRNVPWILQPTSPTCGNYFVEDDEECDCGPAAECDSRCCEPLTCRLVVGARCATGECCDLETCRLKSLGTVCRHVADNQCDLPEYCNGEAEWCPSNSYIANGRACYALSPAYCYKGRCQSRDTQCKYVWGDNSNSSIDDCYTEWNSHGDYYGHCGYTINDTLPSPHPEYLKCKTLEDSFCGMLHCSSPNIRGVPGLPVYVDYYYTDMYINGVGHSCRFVVFDVGLNEEDPGMVPDGSLCGPDKWCKSQKCVQVPILPKHCFCNQRGVCNEHHHCHCEPGYDPHTNCELPGAGGSIESGPILAYKAPVSGSNGLPTATPSPSSNHWVGPVAGTVSGVGVVVIIGAVVVIIKKRQIQEYLNSRKYRRRNGILQRSKVEDLHEAKISSHITLSTDNLNDSSRLKLTSISNPILESSTNRSTVLRDIPASQLAHPSASNPIYYSDIEMPLQSTVPLRVTDMCRKVVASVDYATYSECQFGNGPQDDNDSTTSDDGYENVADVLTKNAR